MNVVETLGWIVAVPVGVLAGTAGYRFGRRSCVGAAQEIVQPHVDVHIWRLLDVLREQWVVVDSSDRVIRQGAQADTLGLVRDGELRFARIRDLARRARTVDGVVEEGIDLELGIGNASHRFLDVRAAPVMNGLILIIVDDQTYAQRVEETRRDFVANVSHELKTPVGGLRLLAEAIEDAADDQDAVERFAARMRIESVRLANLVQEIVDLSRLQVADPTKGAKAVDVCRVATRAVAEMQLMADDREIQLMLHCANPGMMIIGDEELLVTAVRNLVSNAINYSESLTKVNVEVARIENHISVRVTDQGIGIEAADQDRIFERFYRVDPARSRQTGGTGLGLAIVKHVAANHHGDVRVWSEVGVGSTFEILLPALDGRTASKASEESAS